MRTKKKKKDEEQKEHKKRKNTKQRFFFFHPSFFLKKGGVSDSSWLAVPAVFQVPSTPHRSGNSSGNRPEVPEKSKSAPSVVAVQSSPKRRVNIGPPSPDEAIIEDGDLQMRPSKSVYSYVKRVDMVAAVSKLNVASTSDAQQTSNEVMVEKPSESSHSLQK